jgi:hypothetical protein
MRDEEEDEIPKLALEILMDTKEKLLKIFDDGGFDSSYFDVTIDLKFKVDDREIRIKDSWKDVRKSEQ